MQHGIRRVILRISIWNFLSRLGFCTTVLNRIEIDGGSQGKVTDKLNP
jgi:hypothetical protein